MSYLVRTTFDEIAALTDELEIGDRVIFSTEDPDELKEFDLQPYRWNAIYKTNLLYESDYVILIGLIGGSCTVAKDIHILSNGNVDDEDSRIDGIKDFLEEYYRNYMEKNKYGNVYLVMN